MINQNLENITQSGTSQVIDIQASGLNFSTAQGYCIIFCVTLILVVMIVTIAKLIQTAILKIDFIHPKLLEQLKFEILEELK
jgi:hypothetical protein